MKTALSIFLSLVVHVVCFGQERNGTVIAVIEKNNFIKTPKTYYRQILRPLFVKKKTNWVLPDSLPGPFPFYQINTPNTFLGTGKIVPRQDVTSYLRDYYGIYGSKYVLQDMKSVGIDPDSVFDHADILAFRFVTNSSKPITQSTLGKIEISEEDKKLIIDSIYRASYNFLLKQSYSLEEEPWTIYLSQLKTRLTGATITDAQIDKDGNKLIQIKLPNGPVSILANTFSETEFREDNVPLPRLFCVVRPNGEIKLFFADMYLMDHADFDDDGKEEYLFFYSIHNHKGYIMVYDDFNKYVSYTWSYH